MPIKTACVRQRSLVYAGPMYVRVQSPAFTESERQLFANPEYAAFDLVVAAASAGGVAALGQFLSTLPRWFPIPLLVVQHLPSSSKYFSRLDAVLQRRTPLRVKWAEDGEPALPGTVYLAPQNRQILVDPETGALCFDDEASRQRSPLADPLFCSAAHSFGSRVLGVVLSGALSDGAKGCEAIVRAGGRVLPQEIIGAEFPDMPRNAMLRSRVGLAFGPAALAHIVTGLTMAPGAAEWFGIGRAGVCSAIADLSGLATYCSGV